MVLAAEDHELSPERGHRVVQHGSRLSAVDREVLEHRRGYAAPECCAPCMLACS